MRGIVVLPDRNSRGKADWSGAFLPEARRFAKHHGIPDEDVVDVDLGLDQGARAAELLAAVRDRGKGPAFGLVGFFGHGLKGSLPQFRQVTAPLLAGVLASVKEPGVRVLLAACSTAAGEPLTGDGGFADGLRDSLQRAGSTECAVYGHTTAGHATRNPFVRVFEGLGTNEEGALVRGGEGGRWVVSPKDPLWRAWVRALGGDLRLRYCTMSVDEVRAEVSAPEAVS